jgi:hypothetical protein
MKLVSTIVMMILLSSSVLWAQGEPVLSPEMKLHSFGMGFGIPYGVLGANLDFNVAHNLNLTGGVGTTVLAGIGYNIGLKYFFTSVERSFRPRISAYYGVNAIVVKEYGYKDDEGESYTGISLGLGAQWMWGEAKSNGLDFDAIYIATSGYDIDELRAEGFEVDEPGKVKVSIGYRRAF